MASLSVKNSGNKVFKDWKYDRLKIEKPTIPPQ